MNQLERAISGAAMKAMPFDLIESEGSRFHFSGMGWDAAILNDYNAFKGLGDRYPAIKKHITGLPGYLASILFNTIPKEGVKQLIPSFRVKVKIANLGKSVFRIEGGGRPVPARFGRGDIIFRGEINIVGVATTPYYGFSMKAFPYAMTMPGMMNLRIVQAGIPELLLNAGRIWDGVYGGPHFHDFLVSDVEIMTSSPMPMHIGGDAKGLRESMRYRVVPEAVRVLDFNA
jgi:diacylglycerol kinase family enzyme